MNEGLVEWPPSPWRLLRALVATGYSKLGWTEPPEAARRLVDALASTAPTYRLPPALASHTRHFMPTDSPNPDDRTKLFDAFARVGKAAEVIVTWRTDLPADASALLADLVPKLSYLGRAESIVEARLASESEASEGALVVPDGVNQPGMEPITLLAPSTEQEYAAWLAEARSGPHAAAPTKKTAKNDPFPPNAFEALSVDTSFLQKHGWTQPPGSRRVLYYRPPLATVSTRAPRRAPEAEAVDTVLLALASDTRRGDLLPRIERGMPFAEGLHAALANRLGEAACPELTGRSTDGRPLEGHRHTTVVPLDLDRDGRIDHVLVHAAMGFGRDAQRALRSLHFLYTRSGRLFVTVVGLGTVDALSRAVNIRELATATSWQTRTPFVPPRHLKAKRHTLEDQVQAELASRGLPRAVRIEAMAREDIIERRFHHFVRARRDRDRAPPAPRFFGLRIVLEAPVRGPITLGYGSHFGLGVLVPDGTRTPAASVVP